MAIPFPFMMCGILLGEKKRMFLQRFLFVCLVWQVEVKRRSKSTSRIEMESWRASSLSSRNILDGDGVRPVQRDIKSFNVYKGAFPFLAGRQYEQQN